MNLRKGRYCNGRPSLANRPLTITFNGPGKGGKEIRETEARKFLDKRKLYEGACMIEFVRGGLLEFF